MTKPLAFRHQPRYSRSVAPHKCSHAPEAHVAYDMRASGYRAQLHCRCGQIKINGRRLRDNYAAAEVDSQVMLKVGIS